jgi:hypothetical protein
MASLPIGAWVVIGILISLVAIGFVGGAGTLIYRVICQKGEKARLKAEAQVTRELAGVSIEP